SGCIFHDLFRLPADPGKVATHPFDQLLRQIIKLLDPRIICFGLAVILGLTAAFITPVIAALVFVEAISLLRCDRGSETAATVFGCFAIGFGAGLTPLGMP